MYLISLNYIYLKMVKMVNFVISILPQKKKKIGTQKSNSGVRWAQGRTLTPSLSIIIIIQNLWAFKGVQTASGFTKSYHDFGPYK